MCSSWAGFFPSAQLFCDPPMLLCHFLPPGGIQPAHLSTASVDTLYPPHTKMCFMHPLQVSIRCIHPLYPLHAYCIR